MKSFPETLIKKFRPYMGLTFAYTAIFNILLSGCENQERMNKHGFIKVDENVELYYETYGNRDDEACLFIAGAGANSSFWSERLCKKLAGDDFYVVKYDHRDFGYSSKINYEEHPFDIEDLAEDAIKILDSLQIKKAHVIGHSMGGFISQILGIRFPSRVHSITSISASTNSEKIPPPPEKTWELFTEGIPTNNLEKDLEFLMPVWEYLNGTAEFHQELALEYTQNLYKRQVIDEAFGASHVKAQENIKDRTAALSQINLPFLVMHGEEDYLVDKYGGVQTAESVPGAELYLIPKMGHLPFNREILMDLENKIEGFIIKHRKEF